VVLRFWLLVHVYRAWQFMRAEKKEEASSISQRLLGVETGLHATHWTTSSTIQQQQQSSALGGGIIHGTPPPAPPPPPPPPYY
jgi:hypothetical protein